MDNANDNTQFVITPEVDALVDQIEAGGILYYVMGGTASLPPFLTFELHKSGATPETYQAAEMLTKLFSSNADVRKTMIEHAMSIGSAFHEFGNSHPVWHVVITAQ